jgi:hypothetical protein
VRVGLREELGQGCYPHLWGPGLEGLSRMPLDSGGSTGKTISKQTREVLPRASRARRFGIDCESELRWHAKEPGGDYKQKLLIKNVSNQVLSCGHLHVLVCWHGICVPVPSMVEDSQASLEGSSLCNHLGRGVAAGTNGSQQDEGSRCNLMGSMDQPWCV